MIRPLRHSGICLLFLACALPGTAPRESHGAKKSFHVQFLWNGARLEGQTLVRSQGKLLVLGRDGQVWHVSPERVQRSQTTTFQSYSPSVMRNLLIKEFGPGFDVTATGTYLVVHPRGQPTPWAARFDQLHHAMVHYFRVRGISVHKPKFPMVAIVFPNRASFVKYSREKDGVHGESLVGYYHSFTNRIALYDVGADNRSRGNRSKDWRTNFTTLVHEAAHQTAYNTGIHSRFAPPPRWAAEGLATLFEARGIYDARQYPQLQDRINHEQLDAFRHHFSKEIPQGTLARLVLSESNFHQNASANYALSWALTFMMAEKEPRRLSDYLQRTAGRRVFTKYSSAARLRDFHASFGKNDKMLEARLWRFVKEL